MWRHSYVANDNDVTIIKEFPNFRSLPNFRSFTLFLHCVHFLGMQIIIIIGKYFLNVMELVLFVFNKGAKEPVCICYLKQGGCVWVPGSNPSGDVWKLVIYLPMFVVYSWVHHLIFLTVHPGVVFTKGLNFGQLKLRFLKVS